MAPPPAAEQREAGTEGGRARGVGRAGVSSDHPNILNGAETPKKGQRERLGLECLSFPGKHEEQGPHQQSLERKGPERDDGSGVVVQGDLDQQLY